MTEAARNQASPLAAGFMATLDRRRDKPLVRPLDVVSALDDRPPWGTVVPFALQQLAIQSIYFALPALVASAFGADPREATNFLCLSVLGLAGFALFQAATRGPIGSGYPLPAIPTPVMFTAYLLAGQLGATLAEAATLTLLTGLATVALTPVLRRFQMLLPTELAGVVVFLIGASLLPVVFATLHLDPAAPAGAWPGAAIAFGSFAAMAVVALSRTRLAPFAVLVGALAGIAVAVALGVGRPDAGRLLADAAWFALPRPVLPSLAPPDPVLLASFLLCLIGTKASLIGNLVAFQRAADGGWRRLDPVPVRRGMLAQGAAIGLAGLLGGMAPATSSACVGLAIATGTLARRIALAGAAALLLLAFSPRLMALFLLIPDPVKAAMLLYVAGFMMAQGCQMIVGRMLDARRTLVVGLGLSSGLGVLVAPAFFLAAIPALASPLALGALVALLANLVTLPLMVRRAAFALRLGDGFPEALAARCEALGGAWGMRRDTMAQAQNALMELGDLLAGRGVGAIRIDAWHQDDRLVVTVGFDGAPLPAPALRPSAADLDAGQDAFEAVAMALVTRQAQHFRQRSTAAGHEFLLEFQD